MPAFKLIDSETTYQGRNFKVRRDTVEVPGGRQAKYDIVDHSGSVVMVPVDDQGNMIFVRQYRQAVALDLLELPAGTRDGEEPPEICAAREIREETGMAAASMERIGAFYLAPGYSTEFMVAYLATGLSPNPLPADADEFLQVVKLPVREAYELALRGELQDSKSLTALLLARSSLLKYLMD